MFTTLTQAPHRWGGLGALALSLTMASCNQEVSRPQVEAGVTSYAITEDQARQAAENIFASPTVLGQRIASQTLHLRQPLFTSKQRIKSAQTVNAADGKPGLYLFNFEQGGYAIVAADRHMLPILAFNTSGGVPTGDPGQGAAVAWYDWVGTTQAIAEAVRQYPYPSNMAEGAAQAWKMVLDNPLSEAAADAYVQQRAAVEHPAPAQHVGPLTSRVPENNDPPADPPAVQRGPLIQSTWGQATPYNAQCIDGRTNKLCYTGCVPTAMAQVLRYYQYGSAYDWSQMPYTDRSQGYPEMARLFKDIGDDIGTQRNPMPVQCGTSSYRMATSFRARFGYQHAEFRDYPDGNSGTNVYTSNHGSGTSSYFDVKGQFDYSLPVIFGASTDQAYRGPWLHEGAGDSHTFVSDGYIQSYYQGNGYLVFHMNWGEDGPYQYRHDGWYAFNNWAIRNPDGSVARDYHYDKEVTLNITPW